MTAHEVEEMKGRVKEAAGAMTGNEDLKREGKLDQASAKTKDAIDDVADSVKSVVAPKK
jgi:uncharacterized protein YjbJ (UPF0337 family)